MKISRLSFHSILYHLTLSRLLYIQLLPFGNTQNKYALVRENMKFLLYVILTCEIIVEISKNVKNKGRLSTETEESVERVQKFCKTMKVLCCFRTCWLREVGLIDREDKRWFYHKPKCETAGQNFVSVGIQEFYPALVVLAYGIIGSIGILVIEILFFNRLQAKCFALYFVSEVTDKHKSGNQTKRT
jgi:hypothetical protein